MNILFFTVFPFNPLPVCFKLARDSLFWEFLFFLSFAFVLVKSVQMAGILQVFSFLIVPALIGMLYTRKPFKVLLIGWFVGLLASIIGVGISFKFDLPTAPMTVASLSLIFMGSLLVKSLHCNTGAPQ
jgi:zinc/manganese transport system permease protein